MNQNKKLEIKLPKIPDIELVAIKGLEKMGGYFGIPNDKIGEAKIIVNEAIINALEHAGEENPFVNVEFSMTKEKLIILVSDSGKGFNPGEIENPDIREKISSDNKRGWGLKLMKSMSDDLIIESGENGTKISIIKNLI
jgi:anti-sigma regulatory factor (Ser/Thr protein kinase)